jgi:hypothetical protein
MRRAAAASAFAPVGARSRATGVVRLKTVFFGFCNPGSMIMGARKISPKRIRIPEARLLNRKCPLQRCSHGTVLTINDTLKNVERCHLLVLLKKPHGMAHLIFKFLWIRIRLFILNVWPREV